MDYQQCPFGTANTDGREHIRNFGENVFGFEDMSVGPRRLRKVTRPGWRRACYSFALTRSQRARQREN